MNVAIIPARGGSKRIPRKNIRAFNGKPILAYSIEAARESGCVDRVMVSTDDPEIADVARALGAEIPFIRPHNLSDDQTHLDAVMSHAVRWLMDQGHVPEFVCGLFATAPFLSGALLHEGLHRLQASPDKQYAFGVAKFSFPIQRAVRITPLGGIEPFQPACMRMRSQDLEEAYHDAGQFFWGRAEAILNRAALFSPTSIPIVIPSHRVQDIDTPEDWARAEWMHKALMLSENHARSIPS